MATTSNGLQQRCAKVENYLEENGLGESTQTVAIALGPQ